jgi:hypothetical protein
VCNSSRIPVPDNEAANPSYRIVSPTGSESNELARRLLGRLPPIKVGPEPIQCGTGTVTIRIELGRRFMEPGTLSPFSRLVRILPVRLFDPSVS